MYKSVELYEGVGAAGWREILRFGVCGCEFGGEIGEVGECELARVGAVADGEEDEIRLEDVAGYARSILSSKMMDISDTVGEKGKLGA